MYKNNKPYLEIRKREGQKIKSKSIFLGENPEEKLKQLYTDYIVPGYKIPDLITQLTTKK